MDCFGPWNAMMKRVRLSSTFGVLASPIPYWWIQPLFGNYPKCTHLSGIVKKGIGMIGTGRGLLMFPDPSVVRPELSTGLSSRIWLWVETRSPNLR